MILRTAIFRGVGVQRLIAVSLGAFIVATSVLQGAFGRMRSWYGHQEPLVVARCEISCWNEDNRNACVKNCLNRGLPKPGNCPDKDAHFTPFPQICQKDSQCSEITKCCHFCCQTPTNLDVVEGLPSKPEGPKVIEGRRKRTVHIEWSSLEPNMELGNILYLIEERHHTGDFFNSNNFSQWSPCSKSIKNNRLLRHFVKPGKWYQFRVAAVNENGTRGYSDGSLPFRVSTTPKPPKAPQNVTVSPLVQTNGSLTAIMRWSPPISDLPIERYKVFWSRRLQGTKALDSVLVHQQVLPKNTTHFTLRDLQPHSQYFLQVQGILQYGKERLNGEKSGLVLNTTDFVNEKDNTLDLGKSNTYKIEGLRLQKLTWNKGKLKAKIIWNPSREYAKYSVTWWATPCDGRMNAFKHLKVAAMTKDTYFDLIDLQFNCRYKVSVKIVWPDEAKSKHNTFVTFTTPKCSEFKENHKKVRCT
ncbi:anosmin-1 [Diorhabda sublineata]|uniref:anosmin-1 n=1 Tax=Diorhabda sublineata TaxID=1163346 RepID=UPI0024E13B23|nr:anosmin-1 [Diorhabda sublineata]